MPENTKAEARIFDVDSRFVQLARRPGGVARENAVAKAQSHVEDLTSDFNDWLDQELKQLSAILSKIESNPSDMALIESADTNCSQLRDIGATMGYELVTFVAGSLCAILDTIKSGVAYDKDIVDCHMNALFLVRTEPYRNLGPHQVPEMSSGLRRIVELAIQTQPEAPANEPERAASKTEASDGGEGRR
jgi:hypothetical protein